MAQTDEITQALDRAFGSSSGGPAPAQTPAQGDEISMALDQAFGAEPEGPAWWGIGEALTDPIGAAKQVAAGTLEAAGGMGVMADRYADEFMPDWGIAQLVPNILGSLGQTLVDAAPEHDPKFGPTGDVLHGMGSSAAFLPLGMVPGGLVWVGVGGALASSYEGYEASMARHPGDEEKAMTAAILQIPAGAAEMASMGPLAGRLGKVFARVNKASRGELKKTWVRALAAHAGKEVPEEAVQEALQQYSSILGQHMTEGEVKSVGEAFNALRLDPEMAKRAFTENKGEIAYSALIGGLAVFPISVTVSGMQQMAWRASGEAKMMRGEHLTDEAKAGLDAQDENYEDWMMHEGVIPEAGPDKPAVEVIELSDGTRVMKRSSVPRGTLADDEQDLSKSALEGEAKTRTPEEQAARVADIDAEGEVIEEPGLRKFVRGQRESEYDGPVDVVAPADVKGSEDDAALVGDKGTLLTYVEGDGPLPRPAVYLENEIILDSRLSPGQRRRAIMLHELSHHLEASALADGADSDLAKGLVDVVAKIDAEFPGFLSDSDRQYMALLQQHAAEGPAWLDDATRRDEARAFLWEQFPGAVRQAMENPEGVQALIDAAPPGFLQRILEWIQTKLAQYGFGKNPMWERMKVAVGEMPTAQEASMAPEKSARMGQLIVEALNLLEGRGAGPAQTRTPGPATGALARGAAPATVPAEQAEAQVAGEEDEGPAPVPTPATTLSQDELSSLVNELEAMWAGPVVPALGAAPATPAQTKRGRRKKQKTAKRLVAQARALLAKTYTAGDPDALEQYEKDVAEARRLLKQAKALLDTLADALTEPPDDELDDKPVGAAGELSPKQRKQEEYKLERKRKRAARLRKQGAATSTEARADLAEAQRVEAKIPKRAPTGADRTRRPSGPTAAEQAEADWDGGRWALNSKSSWRGAIDTLPPHLLRQLQADEVELLSTVLAEQAPTGLGHFMMALDDAGLAEGSGGPFDNLEMQFIAGHLRQLIGGDTPMEGRWAIGSLAPGILIGAARPGRVKGLSLTAEFKGNNVPRNLKRIEGLEEKFPNPLRSLSTWKRFTKTILSSDKKSLAAPDILMRGVADPKVLRDQLAELSDEQIRVASEGLDLTREIRAQYESGKMRPEDTGHIMVWTFLSRMLSAAPHESAYLMARENGIEDFLARVASGSWTKADGRAYKKWLNGWFPKLLEEQKGKIAGEWAASARSNMNAIGKSFFPALAREVNGAPLLVVLHKMIEDPTVPSKIIRRVFMAEAPGSGMQNKLFSFALLIGGRHDVLVLDRWQVRNLWSSIKGNPYDGMPRYNADGSRKLNDKGRPVPAGFNDVLQGPQGVAMYEGLERGITEAVENAYAELGRDGTVSRYHWESWLWVSDQAVGHASLRAFLEGAKLGGLGVVEGRQSKPTAGDAMVYLPSGERGYITRDTNGTARFFSPTDYQGLPKGGSRKGKAAREEAIQQGRKLSAAEARALSWVPGVAGSPAKFALAPKLNSPAFKAWFKQSAVVDESGKPLVVYHGTSSPGFTAFRRGTDDGHYGDGIYFTANREEASEWAGIGNMGGMPGAVMPVYLSLQNPAPGKLAAELEMTHHTNTSRVLAGMGYDGVVSNEGGAFAEVVVFSPTQIKSATGNRGTYSRTDPDIRNALAPRGKAPPFFSAITQYVEGLKQEKFKRPQLEAMLRKARGVTDEEMKWVGADELFKGDESITKAEVLEWVKAHSVEVRETQYGTTVQGKSVDEFREELENMSDEELAKASKDWTGEEWDPTEDPDAPGNWLIDEILEDYERGLQHFDADASGRSNNARWTEYTLPGGSNDREFVLAFPGKKVVRGPTKKKATVTAAGPLLLTKVRSIDTAEEGDAATEEEHEFFNEHMHMTMDEWDYDSIVTFYRDQFGMVWHMYQLDGPDSPYQIPNAGYEHTEPNAELAVNRLRSVIEELVGTTAERATQRNRRREMDVDRAGVPTSARTFTSHAYNEKNIVAWIRTNERTDSKGRRMLFIEEIQSDWHQAGRKRGYDVPPVPWPGELPPQYKWHEYTNAFGTFLQIVRAEGGGGMTSGVKIANSISAPGATRTEVSSREEAERILWREVNRNDRGVPDGPWKKDWAILGLKRAVKWAADNGFDVVGWTTGKQQAKRYNQLLQDNVTEIKWETSAEYQSRGGDAHDLPEFGEGWRVVHVAHMVMVVDPEGVVSGSYGDTRLAGPLENAVGGKMAELIMSEPSGLVSGEDIQIGGHGMSGFYDRMLPSAAKKLGKRFGVKPEVAGLPNPEVHSDDRYQIHSDDHRYWLTDTWEGDQNVGGEGYEFGFETLEAAEAARDRHVERVSAEFDKIHALPLTDEMRSTVQAEGFSTFAPKFALAMPTAKLGSAKSAIQRFAQHNLTARGNIPEEAFKSLLERDFKVGEAMQEVDFAARAFRRGVKAAYGKPQMTVEQTKAVDAVFKGQAPMKSLPSSLHEPVRRLRRGVDALSRRLIDVGAIPSDLIPVVERNLGVYATRSYRAFDDPLWPTKVPQDVRNKAIALIRKEIIAREKRVPSEDELEGIIMGLLTEGTAAANITDMMKKAMAGEKNLSILKKRTGIPPEIRALLGEYQDPMVNYTRSVTHMAHLIANHEFLQEVRKVGLEQGWLSTTRSPKNYVTIATEGSKVLEPLNVDPDTGERAELYTTPEIQKAFQEATETKALPTWLKTYLGALAAVKIGKTVGSVVTHERNIIGNIGFATAQGHWRVGKMGKAFKTVMTVAGARNIGPWKIDERKWEAYYKEALRLGLIHESAGAGEILDLVNDVANRSVPEAFDQQINKKNLLRKGVDFLAKLYQLEDDLWKLYAWENEKARLRAVYTKEEMSDEQVGRRAAEIVRNTYPTYSLVPRAVKGMRRFPLTGSFVSFPAEVVRTAGNTITQIRDELKDERLRGIGIQRLLGTIMAATGTGAAAMASRVLLGISADDDEDAREFMPPWSRNHDILWVGNTAGKPWYFDLGFTDPYSYLKSPLRAFLRGDDWESKILEPIGEFADPWAGEEILTKALRQVASNKTDSGGTVYNEAGTYTEQAEDILKHLWNRAAEPGTISTLRRLEKARSGQVANSGKAYSLPIEGLNASTGFRLTELDVEQALSFHARDYTRSLGNATRLLSSTASRRGTVDDGELTDAHRSMEQSRQKSFEDMQGLISAASRLGVSRSALRNVLEGAMGQSSAKTVLSGRYTPYMPSSQFLASYARGAPRERRAELARRRKFVATLAREETRRLRTE